MNADASASRPPRLLFRGSTSLRVVCAVGSVFVAQFGTAACGGSEPGHSALDPSGGAASASGGAAGGSLGTGGDSVNGGARSSTSSGGAQATSGGAGSITSSEGGSSNTSSGGARATGGGSGRAAATGAPEKNPIGYGQATTGGGQAKAISAASLSELQAAIDAYSGSGGLVLEYTGSFDFSTIKDPCIQHTLPAHTLEIKEKSDLTILGKDGSAANFGLHIAAASRNIIVRNMTIGLTPGGDASDLISIEGMSSGFPSDIWIDHNELFTSLAVCAGAGDTAFDGMIDVKKGADAVTVSYNYLHDHHKVSLNGFTDSDDAIRHITFHHNLFENIGSRGPLQRHGYSHVLNNYFYNVHASGVNVRMGGYSLVEANYFEQVNNPVTARDSDAIGFWDLRNNNLESAADVAPGNAFGITWDAGNAGTVNATDWKTSAAYPTELGYSYVADPFQCIHDGLRAAVGAGKALATLKCG